MPLYRILNHDRQLQPFRAIDLGERYQERDLEAWIELNPQILLDDEPLLVIGRQLNTPAGILDLVALDAEGSVLIIELKRAPDQRHVIAQALEYAAWFGAQSADHVRELAERYLTARTPPRTLADAWQETFVDDLPAGAINDRQRLFLVVEGEDERITAVARYLRASGLDVNLLAYNYYHTEGGEELLHLEQLVGEEEAPPAQAAARSRPTEAGVVASWPAGVQAAYAQFRRAMVDAGLNLKPKKSGISFYKRTREGQVFLCFVNAAHGGLSVWLRSDSLQARFDFAATARAIGAAVDDAVQINHTHTWYILTTPPRPPEAMVARVARLILEEVGARIA